MHLVTTSAFRLVIGSDGSLDRRMSFWKKIRRFVRVAAAPVTAPTKVVVNVARGRSAMKPIRELAGDVQGAVRDVTHLATLPDQVVIQIAHDRLGSGGQLIAEVLTGSNVHQIELAAATADGFVGIFNGDNPLEVLAIPLTAAISAAATEFRKTAKPIPASVARAMARHFPEKILKKARYAVGKVGINLPEVINGAREFFGNHGHAVTVGNVIVFSRPPSERDFRWWAHELYHVQQYADWGIKKFAWKYIVNWSAVEAEAERKSLQAFPFSTD